MHIAWMFLGYVVAVHVATFVTVAIIVIVSTLPDNGMMGSYYRVISSAVSMLMIGLLITAVYALPGWLISVLIAAFRSIRHTTYFVIGGGLTALSAHVFFTGGGRDTMFGITGEFGLILLWSMIGGLCGGWAYWRVAVVRFGRWRVQT